MGSVLPMLIVCADIPAVARWQIGRMQIARPGQRSRMGNEVPILRD